MLIRLVRRSLKYGTVYLATALISATFAGRLDTQQLFWADACQSPATTGFDQQVQSFVQNISSSSTFPCIWKLGWEKVGVVAE